MAGVEIHVTANFAPVNAWLKQLGEIGQTVGLWDEIGAALHSSTQRRFRTSTAPDGARWQPVQRGGKPLLLHGILRGSISWDATAKGVEVGTHLVYGAIHQFGGTAGRGHTTHLDARPYLGISDSDSTEIHAILERYVARAAA